MTLQLIDWLLDRFPALGLFLFRRTGSASVQSNHDIRTAARQNRENRADFGQHTVDGYLAPA